MTVAQYLLNSWPINGEVGYLFLRQVKGFTGKIGRIVKIDRNDDDSIGIDWEDGSHSVDYAHTSSLELLEVGMAGR